jgi:membrane dipeptidase
MVRHIDYLVERVGIDCVGLGSDFDGAKVPEAIGDVSGLPKLVDALRAAGYDDDALNKLTHQNWLRVLRATWGA